MTDAPKRIYLQAGCNCCDTWDEHRRNHDETTWCDDRVNDDDIEYVRADLVKNGWGYLKDLEHPPQKED